MQENKENYLCALDKLNEKRDNKFKEFGEVINNGEKPMLGVRAADIRAIAKEIAKADPYGYLSSCEFRYFEDTLVYGLVIATLSYEEFLSYLDEYLSEADSWAHVDMFVPSIRSVKKNREVFFRKISEDIFSAEGFRLRFYIVALMHFYLDEKRLPFIFTAVKNLRGKGYYNDMSLAWLISVLFVKFPDETFNFLANYDTCDFVFAKAISKICDSYRVSEADKIKLRRLKQSKRNQDGRFKPNNGRIQTS